MRIGPHLRVGLATALASILVASTVSASALALPPPHGLPLTVLANDGAIRVDQLGYTPNETKVAFLIAARSAAGARFAVFDESGHPVLDGRVGASRGSWNAQFGAVHPIDFGALRRPGTYRIVVDGIAASSPPFRIDSRAALFGGRVADAVAFFAAQRDGRNVIPGALGRKPSHLNDRALTVYRWPTYEDPDSDVIVGNRLAAIGGPVNLAGGWFDAGDFIKFTHTTAYATALLYAAQRELGRAAPASLLREARFGQRWLARAWDRRHSTLYLQVGIGSGNQDGTFNGDHDVWRLPETDDGLTGAANRYLTRRPAFRATDPGKPLPPNLAGRMAATFALAAQVDARHDRMRARRELDVAADLFRRAKTHNVVEADVVTALPHAFYPESSWRDDMEWAGAELALAGQRLHDPRATEWLRKGAGFAAAYLANEAGDDTFNLYDTSALAHADLVRAMRAVQHPGALAVSQRRLLADLRAQLRVGRSRAAGDPFQAGAIYDDFDAAPHTFGLVVTARLYRELTGDRRFDAFATRQRDWALGANPWGTSLMVGVGTTYPHCMQHVVANLSGSVDGSPPILRGAVVNGPNSADLFTDGLGEFFDNGVTCPADGVDRFAQFNGNGSAYVDDVRSWQTVEPAIDFTAAALLAFALLRD